MLIRVVCVWGCDTRCQRPRPAPRAAASRLHWEEATLSFRSAFRVGHRSEMSRAVSATSQTGDSSRHVVKCCVSRPPEGPALRPLSGSPAPGRPRGSAGSLEPGQPRAPDVPPTPQTRAVGPCWASGPQPVPVGRVSERLRDAGCCPTVHPCPWPCEAPPWTCSAALQ